MTSVTGVDDGSGFGVRGESPSGSGLVGEGQQWAGVSASSVSGSGVSAFSDSGAGVLSVSNSGPGVSAQSVKGTGVLAKSDEGAGVVGDGPSYAGVVASSQSGSGVSAFSDSGAGILTVSNSGPGLSAQSVHGNGVESRSDYGIAVKATAGDAVAISADSQGSEAVAGVTTASDHAALSGSHIALVGGTGVSGRTQGQDGIGVRGESTVGEGGIGVYGSSVDGRGVVGTSVGNTGTEGSTLDGIAVYGGVAYGAEDRPGGGRGVVGVAYSATGVEGQSDSGVGVWGASQQGEGVHGETNSSRFAAVAGLQLNPHSTGAGVYGEHKGQGPAGYFKGNVVVTGHLEFAGADCAEEFSIGPSATVDAIEPGTVMVIDPGGGLCPSEDAYDRRVAGVVAGAGDLRPGVVLGRQPGSSVASAGVAVALIGRVYCKVDAMYGAIDVGDLLTTSPVCGHAMKAADAARSHGSVLGKALRPLANGRGLIPILVALQ
jgi:hypothetical protein